jgi:uncharacterized membrane protein
MKTCKSLLLVSGFVTMVMLTAASADAPTITFKFTPVVVGKLNTTVGGINNSGVMVGQYMSKPTVTQSFMLSGKTLTHIKHPNGSNTICMHINSARAIVGNYTDSKHKMKGFVYRNGKFTDIPGPAGATSSQANGINDKGWIVGAYTVPGGGHPKAFLLKGKTYKTLKVPGTVAAIATGINKDGDVVLYAENASEGVSSYLYNGKTYKTINVPDAVESDAYDINSAGDVVYEWFDQNYHAHGALLHNGNYYKFDCPKSMSTAGFGLNDKGVIVGACEPDGQIGEGFKATY